MKNWSVAPFTRITLLFALGILSYRTGFLLPYHDYLFSLFYAIVIFSGAWLLMFRWVQSFRNRNVNAALLLIIVFLGGFLTARYADPQKEADFIGNQPLEEQVKLIMRIDNETEKRGSIYKTTARIESIQKDGAWMSCSGKILLYLSEGADKPEYGDRIAARCYVNKPDAPVFNSDFNYRKYLSDKGIFHQAFVSHNQWVKIDSMCGNPIIAFSLGVRNSMVDLLRNHIGDNDEYAVVSAMMTGYRADLSADMLSAYSKAGVIHIMSVSGLHVGVIYLMISFILGLIGWLKKRPWIKVIFVLSLIWFYAIITGLSASVLRSAIMISFIVAGEALRRKINPFNSLAAAAFFLLLIQPNSIGEAGFQLSFTAVAGIFMFYRPLYNVAYFKRKIFDKTWQLVCVSLAAQIATLPLILYHFGQFPVYFLLANLIIVPLSGFILYAAMALLLLSGVPGVSETASWITFWMAKIMNELAKFFEQLPGAAIEDIHLGFMASIMLALVIWFVYEMILRKKIRYLYVIIISVFAGAFFQVLEIRHEHQQSFGFVLKDGKQYVSGIKVDKVVYLIIPERIVSPFVAKRISRYIKRHHYQTVFIDKDFNNGIVFRRKEWIAAGSLRVMMHEGYRLPQLQAGLMPDIMIAPNLSNYHQKKYLVLAPDYFLMTKSNDVHGNMVSLFSKKDFRADLQYFYRGQH